MSGRVVHQLTGPVITIDVDDIDEALPTIKGVGGTRRRPAGDRLGTGASSADGADTARVARTGVC